jgi:uncharacterized protein HemY
MTTAAADKIGNETLLALLEGRWTEARKGLTLLATRHHSFTFSPAAAYEMVGPHAAAMQKLIDAANAMWR